MTVVEVIERNEQQAEKASAGPVLSLKDERPPPQNNGPGCRWG